MDLKRIARSMAAAGFAAFLIAAQTGWAAKFANQFSEFELPPQWQCVLEGAEWVCQSQVDAKKRDAIIILAAKLQGPQDSMDQYLNYLKNPKSFTSVQGRVLKSDPKYAQIKELNGHPWVDALHFQSELPGFNTRYLATIKTDIGVLVTYSVKQDKWGEYVQDFENLVRTLRVFRKPGAINVSGANSGSIFDQVAMPDSISATTVFPAGGEGEQATPKQQGDDSFYFYAALGGLAVAFLIWRRRQNSQD